MKLVLALSFFVSCVLSQSTTLPTSNTASNSSSIASALPGQPSECLVLCVAGALQSQIALSLANPCNNSTLSAGFSSCVTGEKCGESNLASQWTSICQIVTAELKVPLSPTSNSNNSLGIPNSTIPSNSATPTGIDGKTVTSASGALSVGLLSLLFTWVAYA